MVIPTVVRSLVLMNGQFCCTGSRVLVHRDIADKVRTRLTSALAQVRLGSGGDGDGTVIAQARHLATQFLTRVQTEQGLPVSQRALDLTQLVVSELVTNARKYAPGPVLMDLSIVGDMVEVVVWDSHPVLPVARAADAGRVGQHGLEIVMAVSQGFEVQREPVGKRISARIALLDDPGGAIAGRSPL